MSESLTTTSTGSTLVDFRSLVYRLAKTSTTYRGLDEFLNSYDARSGSPPRFTIVTIAPENTPFPLIAFEDLDGTEQLATLLNKSSEPSEGYCRLFLVENICPRTMILLGEHFNIDPRFFADHLSNPPWYRIEDVSDRIPALPSCQKFHDFLQLRFIEVRTVENCQLASPEDGGHELANPYNENLSTSSGLHFRADQGSDAKSFMMPDERTTNIPRKAGKLNPRARKGKTFEPLLCTRQAVTVWFEERKSGANSWTGM